MTNSDTPKVVTRFAPSPTGFMHIGSIRTALFAHLCARKNGGTFILRIEDTDRARLVEGSIEHIQESLSWLGIDWDFGPQTPGPFGSTVQSERLETYRPFADMLVAKGLAYPDPYTTEEITALREKAQAEKRPFLMREHRPETFEKWDGKQPLRFKVPEIKRYTWHDAARGELEAGEEALDDFIIMKGDGWPTYNFAHIIDDHLMQVTHVMRGDEFISSTPRFLSLYDALEIPWPVFVTLPPIMGPDGKKKLGKRDGAKDVLAYRTEGYLPEAMVNFLALIGWNPGTEQEIFTKDELIEHFSIDQIQHSGGAFNEEKLRWMNRQHLLRLSMEQFVELVVPKLAEHFANAPQWSPERAQAAASHVLHERINTLGDIDMLATSGELNYLFTAPEIDATKLVWKTDTSDVTAAHLKTVSGLISSINEESVQNSEHVKSAIMPEAEAAGKGSVLWPLRFSLSGAEKSPDPFTLVTLFGKTESLARIERAAATLTNA
jgi:glutamyl-tRNA synthetase